MIKAKRRKVRNKAKYDDRVDPFKADEVASLRASHARLRISPQKVAFEAAQTQTGIK